ncbi:MAG: DUF1553 domain-containing protein [Acidobacteriota bacterium]
MSRVRRSGKVGLLLVVLLVLIGMGWVDFRPTATASEPAISFNRDIRPIFSDTCFRCHGPDKSGRQAGLRLDVRDEAMRKTRSGIIPIVPGKPEESEVVRRIFSDEPAEVMPPEEAHKTLTARQKELIKRWIAEGAVYEGHWAYQPIVRPAVPTGGSRVNNPIDRFIQSRLASESMTPAPEADRRTLIRRVTLDLTGIPPTPAEIAAFVDDRSPDAYARVVDRLLASPRYAEKQTMHWLDAVRYADTAGFHGDNAFPAWPYRDYVLRAFQSNMPFDRFTREQLAGDLIPGATVDQKIASAYNRLNRMSSEGGLQPVEYLAKYAADRVRTTSIVWLGATMGCAECHDHKFDPYLAKDFYAMKAFFADIKETGLVPSRGKEAWGSRLTLPSAGQQAQHASLTKRYEEQREALRHAVAAMPDLAARQDRLRDDHQAGRLEWQFQRPLTAVATGGARTTIYNDRRLTVTEYIDGNLVTKEIDGAGLIVVEGPNPENSTYTVRFRPAAGTWTALGLEVAQDESLPANRIARGADRFVVSEIEASIVSPAQRPLGLMLANSDRAGEWPENHPMNAIDGDRATGWGSSWEGGRGAFIALRLARPLKTDGRTVVQVRLRHDSPLRRATIGRFRLALSSARHSWPDVQAKMRNPLRGLPAGLAGVLGKAPAERTAAQSESLLDHLAWSEPTLEKEVVRLARLEAELEMLNAQIPQVVYTESVTPAVTKILPRGNFLDESGEVVTPAIPVAFGRLPVDGPLQSGPSGPSGPTDPTVPTRLDLANWIVSRDNPLTARVFANRMWRQFFGVGLSKTLDDLGSQGEWPTHPELLDWLAAEFMEPSLDGAAHQWDVRHLIRTIVMSHTYRQAAPPPADDRDPDNRLLARQNRIRVDAEIVRDIALSLSGLLVEKLGGPSIKPVQPERYLAALNFPQRDYSADRGQSLYRRGLYVHWQRTFLHPSLSTFDAPSREECTVNRVNSNTPLQALVLLNDPIFVESARVFAARALTEGGLSTRQQIEWAFEQATGRRPLAAEMDILLDLHRKGRQSFVADPLGAQRLTAVGEAPVGRGVPPVRLAAMTTVTRAILNLHETITRN